ncbi:MAG: DUF6041 domain-containing protein [Paracoccaceae bacterium]
MNWRAGLERVIGASFVFAGAIKVLGVGEDTHAVFRNMTLANADTVLASLSRWLLMQHSWVIIFVGVIMIATGALQLMRYPSAPIAALIQTLMMICFVILLHRGQPMVFVDAVYLISFALIYFDLRPRDGVLL